MCSWYNFEPFLNQFQHYTHVQFKKRRSFCRLRMRNWFRIALLILTLLVWDLFCSTMLWWLVVSSNGKTGWQVISLTLKRCPEARLLCPMLNTWLNLLLSAKVSCHKFKVPLSCFVTNEITGEVSFCSSHFGITYN